MDYRNLLQLIANVPHASDKVVGFESQRQRARYDGALYPNVVTPSGVKAMCRSAKAAGSFIMIPVWTYSGRFDATPRDDPGMCHFRAIVFDFGRDYVLLFDPRRYTGNMDGRRSWPSVFKQLVGLHPTLPIRTFYGTQDVLDENCGPHVVDFIHEYHSMRSPRQAIRRFRRITSLK